MSDLGSETKKFKSPTRKKEYQVAILKVQKEQEEENILSQTNKNNNNVTTITK